LFSFHLELHQSGLSLLTMENESLNDHHRV
jgi:hypothetical protein